MVNALQRKILLLAEVFGSGHTIAAEALVQSITKRDPSIQTEILIPGSLLSPHTTSFFQMTYKKMITQYPFLWRAFYYTHQKKTLHPLLRYLIYQTFHRNLKQLITLYEPNLIISTHPFNSSSLSQIKKQGFTVPVCTVITDLHVHPAWVHPEVDLYIVSDQNAREQLMNMGISPMRIKDNGIPVRMNFWKKNNKQVVRKKLNLNNLPTVIVMGGGWGLGKIKEIAHLLLKWKDSIQLIVCAGKNEVLKASLSENERFQHENVTIIGYVERIDKYFDAADIVITKPGGITCFEVLTKGVPLLLYDPISGHEEYNCDRLIDSNLAIKINDMQEIDIWIEKLLFTPESFTPLFEQMKKYRASMHPFAAADSVINLLDED